MFNDDYEKEEETEVLALRKTLLEDLEAVFQEAMALSEHRFFFAMGSIYGRLHALTVIGVVSLEEAQVYQDRFEGLRALKSMGL